MDVRSISVQYEQGGGGGLSVDDGTRCALCMRLVS